METINRPLFSIGADLEALEALLDEAAGDISNPAVAAAVKEWFAEIRSNQGEKIDRYVSLLRKWEGQAVAAKAEAEQYQKAAQVRTNCVKALKERLKLYLDMTHQTKVETPTGRTVAVQKNGGKVPMEVLPDVNPLGVEERFQLKTISLNTDAVRMALEAGEELKFARLGARGTHLAIR
jgi:hypothetical protein